MTGPVTFSSEALPARPLRLAAGAWPLEWHADWEGFASKLSAWVETAASHQATHAALPEYMGMEAAFVGPRKKLSVAEWFVRASDAAEDFRLLSASLAHRHGLTLLSGSLPVREHGGWRNRAWLCAPGGCVTAHDKQVLTPWERAATPLSPGTQIIVGETADGRLGVLICYDAEFPVLAQAMAPDILLVPSCTEALAGQSRVRAAARARALEQQAVTVHAPLLGAIAECEIVDANRGRAGIFGPPDLGFPDDGILADGELDAPGWVFADLPRGALSATRANGAIATRAHSIEAAARAKSVRTTGLEEQTP
ncbi:MAG: nitrilase-related carbon-nitrogen hydrolase [Pseudomonadota bacterium]